MDNEGIYSVGKDLVKQNITFCQTETFVGPSRVGPSHEIVVKLTVWHNSSSSSCALHVAFLQVASCEVLASQS